VKVFGRVRLLPNRSVYGSQKTKRFGRNLTLPMIRNAKNSKIFHDVAGNGGISINTQCCRKFERLCDLPCAWGSGKLQSETEGAVALDRAFTILT
jgi:hypothetical protein